MNRPTSFAAALLLAAFVTPATAQVRPGVFGYLVQGTVSTAGEFCHVFDCTARQHVARAGETLRLTVNAPANAFFAIAASFTARSCVTIPGVQNMLVLDPSIVTIAIGTVSTPSPILACWGGTVDVRLPIPVGLPPGTAFATQAVAAVPGLGSARPQPAFSVAVQSLIR